MVKERVVLGIGYSKYNFMCVVSVMVKVINVLFKNKNLFEMWWRCLKKKIYQFFFEVFRSNCFKQVCFYDKGEGW